MVESFLEQKMIYKNSINEDKLFSLFSNRRRRFVLDIISKSGGTAKIGEIADKIVDWETKADFDSLSSSRKNVYTSLQQNHLPKMEEAGVIQYNKEIGTVELTENAKEYSIYLEVVRSRDIPWSQYYFTLSTLSMLLVFLVSIDVISVGFLSNFSWGIFISVLFFVSSLINFYIDRYQKLGSSGPPPEIKN